MTNEEIVEYRKYKERFDRVQGVRIFLGLLQILFSLMTFLFLFVWIDYDNIPEQNLLIGRIAFFSFIIFWILITIRKSKYNAEEIRLMNKYKLLDLKMKGYEKTLKKSGLNINISSRDNDDKNVGSDGNLLKQKLNELNKLREDGVLTEKEYNLKRKQIIEKY